MDLDFAPITLEQKEKYYDLWHVTPRRSLDYTLANLWGWQEYYDLEWHFGDEICWIRQNYSDPLLWAPLGNWDNVDWKSEFAKFGRAVHVSRVPEELAKMWLEQLPGVIEMEEDRGQWEYLYLQSDLAALSGNRFHKKRNHYNSYVKAYGEPVYAEINREMVDAVLSLQDDWCQSHECDDSPSLRAENDAIKRVLTHWDVFEGLRGGALSIDGKMVAFSVGEPLDAETLGVHFEKGLQGYKGVYQAMNLQFASHAGAGFKWINRAQDLGEEGLRQAKLTYMPSDYLRKFKVVYHP